ncbi:MAG: phenylalanine--tRNA ligase subunit beta [Chthoniobacterales bacterium]|nr:phenylalanine--tRNA ligase subunit beta [Chthoniobacterales bacterium]
MKFSLNWLGEFVELPNDTATLAELLTLAGVEIEGIEKRGANFEHVVVAQINASTEHPNADRLSVCQVDDGSGQPRQIVCGAKNYKVGDKVPLALPGAVLPNDFKIKASKLRGVESQGMLCSAKELALAEDSAGLLILSPEAKIGAPIGELFPNDTILDVEITPNRADLLSHYGLAREIAALTQKPLRKLEIAEPATRERAEVQISAPNECPFYSARRIENVTVGSSPAWLRAKLEAVGLRSVNNVVDITNFVMLELGQPLHAFDAAKLTGGINVRLARPNEKFLALDGRTYQLDEKMLLIADAERAVGIGGVMGGDESGVTEATRAIVLESAYFQPSNIRRTARELNLPSDASYRFERGVDPGMILRASARATQLLQEIAGGAPANETVVAGILPAPPTGFSLRYARCSQLLGTAVLPSEADRILEGFGLEKLGGTIEQATWKIPSYRADLRREVDLIEEVVRVFGINRIEGSNRSCFSAVSSADRRYDFESKLRQRLAARGFCEARTSALVGRESLGGGFGEGAVELRNPLSEDHVALRPSLVPGLLGALERNVRAGAKSVRLFEIGRAFFPPDGAEARRVALLLSGQAESQANWRGGRARPLDLFDLKGALEALGLGSLRLERSESPNFALVTNVFSEKRQIGVAGQVSSAHAAPAGATAPVFLAELNLPNDFEITTQTRRFQDLQRFPSITRDIALFAPESITHAAILSSLTSGSEPLLVEVELFDLFSGKGSADSGGDRKSLAYSLTYRDKNRTLTSDEVNAAHDRIRERLRSELGVELRE